MHLSLLLPLLLLPSSILATPIPMSAIDRIPDSRPITETTTSNPSEIQPPAAKKQDVDKRAPVLPYHLERRTPTGMNTALVDALDKSSDKKLFGGTSTSDPSQVPPPRAPTRKKKGVGEQAPGSVGGTPERWGLGHGLWDPNLNPVEPAWHRRQRIPPENTWEWHHSYQGPPS